MEPVLQGLTKTHHYYFVLLLKLLCTSEIPGPLEATQRYLGIFIHRDFLAVVLMLVLVLVLLPCRVNKILHDVPSHCYVPSCARCIATDIRVCVISGFLVLLAATQGEQLAISSSVI